MESKNRKHVRSGLARKPKPSIKEDSPQLRSDNCSSQSNKTLKMVVKVISMFMAVHEYTIERQRLH